MSRCISCKGRGFCGRSICPILKRLEEIASIPKLSSSLAGYSPPDIFVGRHGYPVVNAGPLIPIKENDAHQNPGSWLGLDISEIIALRTMMVRSGTKVKVKEANSPEKILRRAQEMAMSSMPVEAEVSFLKPPCGNLRFDGVISPTGPSGTVKELEITSNPIVPRKVDQFVDDTGIGAADASCELYISGIEIGHISRLLSLGLLGQKRKLVPTRWSITATDDMIGKSLIEEILDMPIIGEYQVFSGEALGNHFEIILMPAVYSFELIEIWLPRSIWSMAVLENSDESCENPKISQCSSGKDCNTHPGTWIGADREGPRKKKRYSNLSGGYYAARLAVLEYLSNIRRQASILVLREISGAYWAPLGVWVVREAARQVMKSPPQKFEVQKEIFQEIEKRISTPKRDWEQFAKSITIPSQKTLANFYGI
jgi:hypothetical protein